MASLDSGITQVTVTVLRVFTSADRTDGNPLGVIDGSLVEDSSRQKVAKQLAFSETVFIDDWAQGRLRIFTPIVELASAGHPLVGTAWLLAHLLGENASTTLNPPGGEVNTWTEKDGTTWIDALLTTLPEWNLVELEDADSVRALRCPLHDELDNVMYWSYITPANGTIRARVFAPRYGVSEDEATGSAALRLSTTLNRPITIHQGRGSVLHARPIDATRAAVGGLVTHDPPQRVTLPMP